MGGTNTLYFVPPLFSFRKYRTEKRELPMNEHRKSYTGSRMDQSLVGRRETKRYEDEIMAQPALRRSRPLPVVILAERQTLLQTQ